MIWLLALGCRPEPAPPDPLMDTGWFSETDADTDLGCTDHIIETAPSEGEAAWYWRESLTVAVSSPTQAAYDLTLRDGDGRNVPAVVTFSDQVLTLTPNAPLRPSTAYNLIVSDCLGVHAIPFQTSAFGTALSGGPSSVVHRTFEIKLSKARWVKPKGFGTILALYFTTPILIGVDWADERIVDLLGAPGGVTTSGAIVQDTSQPTWDFPVADFTQAPWFHAEAAQMTLVLEGASLDIYGFSIEGTFAEDASVLGGGIVEGLADTRKLGALLGSPDDEAAVCKLAATLGATCEPCPDGETLCMSMSARDVEAKRLEGVSLRRVDAE